HRHNFEFQWNSQLISETAERIARGACGVLSFIALITWCRWRGTPQDQREVTPPEVPKRRERLKGNGGSIRRLHSDFDNAIICVTVKLPELLTQACHFN